VVVLSVRDAAVILVPRHLAGIGDQIPAADVVVLTPLGTTQTREVAFRPIGADAFVHERD